MSLKMSKQAAEPIDVQSIIEQGKTILAEPPTTPESVKETLQTLSSGVEQVRYTEGEHLSSTGKAILEDLEQVLVSGAELSEAIPTETFLHAARAQQDVREAIRPEKMQVSEETKEEAQKALMDAGRLLKTIISSADFRHFAGDTIYWLRDVLFKVQQRIEEPTKKEKQTIGQVTIEEEEPITKELHVSDEQLDRLISMLEWSQERPEYQESIGFIFDQLQMIPTLLGMTEEEPEEEVAVDREAMAKAVEEAKVAAADALKALENWTHRSFTPLKEQIVKIAENLKSDKQLNNTMSSFTHFLNNCFTQPGYLNDRQWIRQEASDLISDLQQRLSPQNRSDFQALFDESRSALEAIGKEPKTAHLKESLKRLLEDLFISKETAGQEGILPGFQLKTELVSDLGVIVGGLMERVRFLRLPDLEIHDEEFDFTAHNIVLDAAELVPQQFKMTLVTENMLERAKMEKEESVVGLSEEEKHKLFVERDIGAIESRQPAVISAAAASPWATFLKFEVKGVRGHCHNLHFTMRKRSGFPQLSDEGVADLRVWGAQGMLVKVVLKPEWITEETVERTITSTHETSNLLISLMSSKFL